MKERTVAYHRSQQLRFLWILTVIGQLKYEKIVMQFVESAF